MSSVTLDSKLNNISEIGGVGMSRMVTEERFGSDGLAVRGVMLG